MKYIINYGVTGKISDKDLTAYLSVNVFPFFLLSPSTAPALCWSICVSLRLMIGCDAFGKYRMRFHGKHISWHHFFLPDLFFLFRVE